MHDKIMEGYLRWFGHVCRMLEAACQSIKKSIEMKLKGKNKIARSRRIWNDGIKEETEKKAPHGKELRGCQWIETNGRKNENKLHSNPHILHLTLGKHKIKKKKIYCWERFFLLWRFHFFFFYIILTTYSKTAKFDSLISFYFLCLSATPM